MAHQIYGCEINRSDLLISKATKGIFILIYAQTCMYMYECNLFEAIRIWIVRQSILIISEVIMGLYEHTNKTENESKELLKKAFVESDTASC